MTPEQRTRAIVHNAADRALSSRGHWVPLSVRVAIAETVLAALAEQGMVIVPAEDLRIVSSPRSPVLPDEITAHLDARARLRSVLSGTAPQPSETPQDAQTAGGGISGRSDTPNASEGLSDAHADDLRRRYAEALWKAAEYAIVAEWICCDPVRLDHDLCQTGDAVRQVIRSLIFNDRFAEQYLLLPDAVLAVRDTELEQLRAALHTYENTITWFTTCHGCAKTLDSSYAETVRAEKAEAALVHAKALHSRDDSNPHGPWCGTCTTRWPCRTWTALLPAGNPPATTTEEKPHV